MRLERVCLPSAETSRHDRARDLPLENDVDEQAHDQVVDKGIVANYRHSDGRRR